MALILHPPCFAVHAHILQTRVHPSKLLPLVTRTLALVLHMNTMEVLNLPNPNFSTSRRTVLKEQSCVFEGICYENLIWQAADEDIPTTNYTLLQTPIQKKFIVATG